MRGRKRRSSYYYDEEAKALYLHTSDDKHRSTHERGFMPRAVGERSTIIARQLAVRTGTPTSEIPRSPTPRSIGRSTTPTRSSQRVDPEDSARP